jgi:putative chitinase
MITKEQLTKILNTGDAALVDKLLPGINEALVKFQINTPLRISHFLAQLLHESGNLLRTIENLNYGAPGLLSTFRKYFTVEQATQYARKPEKIAARVYANRMENGDEATGDGWKYRGRGYIQLTGKSNYKALTESLNVDFVANPDLVATPQYAALSAGWYWNSRGINKLADADDILKVTKAINGGTIGLEDRKHHLAHVKSIIK